jgi:hypothetical protein
MIQWGLAGGNGFQNALATGLQFGQIARQRTEEREYKNALAAYDPAKPETIKPIMQADPRVGIQLQRDAAAQAAERAKQQQADAGTFRRLLKHAAQSPEGWQQAVGAAQNMGLDLSGIPQQYDPDWAKQQLFIIDAMEDPDKRTAIQQDIESLGIDPSSPEGVKAVGELILYKYGKPITDEQGRPSLALPQITVPQAAPVQHPPRPEGKSDTELFSQAREAVEQGANVEEVFRRLEAWGVQVQ